MIWVEDPKTKKIALALAEAEKKSPTNLVVPEVETSEKAVVNGLWIGPKLPPMALLTIHSFLRHGAEFKLWTYESIENVPAGCVLEDANEVLPEDRVFSYTGGPGEGSVAGFSDIFRAKLLYDKGGWWTDMDVTLMQDINTITEEDYLFRKHWNNVCVGNFMKVPAQSPVMRAYYDSVALSVNKNNKDWEKPIRLLGLNCLTSRFQYSSI